MHHRFNLCCPLDMSGSEDQDQGYKRLDQPLIAREQLFFFFRVRAAGDEYRSPSPMPRSGRESIPPCVAGCGNG